MPIDLPPADPGFELSVASRGYSKGIAQTENGQFVLRPTLAVGNLRLGAYAKNVDSPSFDGEAGVSAGLSKSFRNTEVTASATVKRLIGGRSSVDGTALELAVSAAQSIGSIKPRLSLIYSPDDLATTGRSMFLEGAVNYQIGKKISLSSAVGKRNREGGPDYTSFNVGGSFTIEPLTLDLRWYDTSRSSLNTSYRGRAVVSVRAKL